LGDDSSTAPLPLGAVIGGKYTLARVLGTGGMGAVYEAHNSWTGRRVAVKVLLTEHARRKDVVDRFTQEARATTQIAHPNIVDILDMGQDADTGALFIVQEFLDGMDLGRWLEQHGPYAPEEAVGILMPIMGALVAAHRRGVIHRDLKPENIFLARNAGGVLVPKLIDFGISKFIDQANEERSRTQTGMAVGTPQYMSPEQARGDRDVDARSDVWSIAVVLYELLSGAPPFDAPSYNLLIVQLITQTPARIETVMTGVPAALADVLHHALEPDRDRRFHSMQVFLGALIAAMEPEGVQVATTPSWLPPAALNQPFLEFDDGDATRVAPSTGNDGVSLPDPENASAGADVPPIVMGTSLPTLTPATWSDTATNPAPESSRLRWRTLAVGASMGLLVASVAVGVGLGLNPGGASVTMPASLPSNAAQPPGAATATSSTAMRVPMASVAAQPIEVSPLPGPDVPIVREPSAAHVTLSTVGVARTPSPTSVRSPSAGAPSVTRAVTARPAARVPVSIASPPVGRRRPANTAPIIGVD
jgi:serine/threonine protein kinase